jgi:glycosyltransferase involved in cell wall biosynthesis
MPLRNSESVVAAAIASVLEQRDCVAEILISDDQSTDGTLAAARDAVASWRGPHHVRVLRATRRLAIDHIGALAALATSRLLVQAHGDDIALPGRLARLLAIHRRDAPALITSLCRSASGTGIVSDTAPKGWIEGFVPLISFVAWNPRGIMAGSRYALDRRVFEDFPRLDSSYLRIGHDALQAFRAWLVAGVWFCPDHLILRSGRPGQWSSRLWDERWMASRHFGFALHRLGVMRAMLTDLAHAREHKTVAADRIARAQELVTEGIGQMVEKLIDARDELSGLGLAPMWVAEETLQQINQDAAAKG